MASSANPSLRPIVPTSDPVTAGWLETTEKALGVLEEEGPAIEAGRELTARALDALHGAHLFRLSLPRSVGGYELPVPALAAVTERVAQTDASAAWCLGQGLGCAMSAAFLEPATRREVFGPDAAVLAWGAGIQGTATACEGGYQVSGTWRFASGGKHATWLGAHCRVLEADGTVRLTASGRPANRTALLPRASARIHDDWYVMGLKGTRSESYTVEDLFIEERFTLDREILDSAFENAPLYRFPTTNVYASMFSGVALGIARRLLDDFIGLAGKKTARGAPTSMRESPVIHTRLAEIEAKLGAARAYQRQTIETVWEEVVKAGAISLSQRARLRLATTHAINEAATVA